MGRKREYKKYYFNYIIRLNGEELHMSQYEGDMYLAESKKKFVEENWDKAEVTSDIIKKSEDDLKDIDESELRYQFNFDMGYHKNTDELISLTNSDNYDRSKKSKIFFEQMGSDKKELRKKAEKISELDYVVVVTEVIDRKTSKEAGLIKNKSDKFYNDK